MVRVLAVFDGDTIEVLMHGRPLRVRLSAIDSPENGQPWGTIARNELKDLIGGRNVLLERYGKDVYSRTLATLYVFSGNELVNVNENMVMRGHAWVMRKYYGHLSKSRQVQLDRLEEWARNNQVGLWKHENPIPPWQWRNDSPKKKSG